MVRTCISFRRHNLTLGASVPPRFWLVASTLYQNPRIVLSGNHDMNTRASAGHATACPAPFALHSTDTATTRNKAASGLVTFAKIALMHRHVIPEVKRQYASSFAGSGWESTYTPQKNLTIPTTASNTFAWKIFCCYFSTSVKSTTPGNNLRLVQTNIPKRPCRLAHSSTDSVNWELAAIAGNSCAASNLG